MKQLSQVLTAAFLMVSFLPVAAVTDKEMEEARTITAQAYLRYANDGSGYLDEINVSTMADLKSKLKKQELENLKTFTAVTSPADYASWDKARLLEYWSDTFFESPGLLEKGKQGGARKRVKRKIECMAVGAPASVAQKEEPANMSADPLEGLETMAGADSAVAAVADTLETMQRQLEESIADEGVPRQENSYTWLYIAILAVLVGVVIWLVIFASRVMKRNEETCEAHGEALSPYDGAETERLENEARLAAEENATLRERFASALASKNEEIRVLNSGMENLQNDNERLQGDVARLKEENRHLRQELAQFTRMSAQNEMPPLEARPSEPAKSDSFADDMKVIFLGRANNRGIFIRADRKLNIGHTLYRLDTSDGYAGTFRVVSDPTVWEMALLTPAESLGGACLARDLGATEGMSRVVTDSPGTAIFEGGCWKVIRKAKIHYE